MDMVCKEQFETIGDGLLVRAPAKINLSLLIAGKRPDGYHEIDTIMAKINFYDEIFIERSKGTGIELICRGPHWAPSGKENLVYQAAQLLMETQGESANIKITLTKNVPAGRGLGSASSDAAATLIAVNKYLDFALPITQLAKLAEQLGSDVAFFLNGPLAFCTGRGEKIKKLAKNFNFLALLMLPNVSVSTKKVYDNYRHNPALYEKLSNRIKSYIEQNRIDLVSRMCANMLQNTCFSLHKELADLKARIELEGMVSLCLSGSGSAMFCIIDSGNEEEAKRSKIKIEDKVGCESIIVSCNKW